MRLPTCRLPSAVPPVATLHRVSAIVFDLDGTLVDSFDDICAAFCRSFHVVSHAAPAPAVVRTMIGKPLREMYAPWVPASAIETLVAEYRRDYAERCADQTRPYPGIVALLEDLRSRGHLLAVATTKTTAMARTVVARLGLEPHLDHVQGTDGFPHKPAPDVIERALAGLASPGVWMIGDATTDVQAGRAAGLRTCAVTWGVHAAADLRAADPDAVADSVDALRSLLLP